MRLVVLLIAALMCASLKAQPGFYAAMHNLEAPYWNLLDPMGSRFLNNGFGAGAQYRIPLSEGIFSFLPGFHYGYFQQQSSLEGRNQAHIIQLSGSFRIHPMEFFLNCDCPSYKRGLFAEGFAGWSRWDFLHKELDVRIEDSASGLVAGFAAGMQIPYGERFSITPVFRYSHYPSITWQGLNALRNPDSGPFFREETFLRQMSFEIHILFGQ
jgi:hypothetical protein